MSKQPLRDSVYDAYSSVGETLKLLLEWDDIYMIKGGIRAIVKHCEENDTPKRVRTKLANKTDDPQKGP